MSDYRLTWITDRLALGHAPMSYDELKSIRDQGIDGIVNLCGEYCDLHRIEQDYGFEVYYLPVEDDRAPSLEEVEKALEWMDESIYLGKKILVHCRHGIGRTGTFVTSYLLRRGFSLKLAKEKLKNTRSGFTSFDQWWFLRKFGKKEGKLTLRKPSLEGNHLVDLSPYFDEYEYLVNEVETAVSAHLPELPRCGRDTDACCNRLLHLQFIEAAYLNHYLNKKLSREDRLAAIHRAITSNQAALTDWSKAQIPSLQTDEADDASDDSPEEEVPYRCPLSVEGKCIAYPYRPVVCRLYGTSPTGQVEAANRDEHRDAEEKSRCLSQHQAAQTLYEISRRLFFALNRSFPEGKSLLFPLTHVVSGKFIQDYFNFLSTFS